MTTDLRPICSRCGKHINADGTAEATTESKRLSEVHLRSVRVVGYREDAEMARQEIERLREQLSQIEAENEKLRDEIARKERILSGGP